MEQSRSNRIVIFALVLAMGLFFEVLNTIRRSESAKPSHGLDFSVADISPFHVSTEQMLADRLAASSHHKIGMRLSGRPTKFNSYDFSGGNVLAKKAKGKVKIKKKVKKLKKKKPAARGRVQIKTQKLPLKNIQPDDQSHADQSAAITNGIETQTVTNTKGTAQAPGKDNTQTYQQWASVLLPTTTKAVVDKLIQYYQRGMVSNGVFYQLLNAMVAEPTASEQLLAMYAADVVPGPQSFVLLVSTLANNSNNSTIVTTGYQYIDSYAGLGLVPDLKAVFQLSISDPKSSSDQTLASVAARVLNMSTSANLGSRSPTSTTGGGATTSQASANELIKAYGGFIPILENVMKVYAGNTTLLGYLNASLNLIKKVEPPATTR